MIQGCIESTLAPKICLRIVFKMKKKKKQELQEDIFKSYQIQYFILYTYTYSNTYTYILYIYMYILYIIIYDIQRKTTYTKCAHSGWTIKEIQRIIIFKMEFKTILKGKNFDSMNF